MWISYYIHKLGRLGALFVKVSLPYSIKCLASEHSLLLETLFVYSSYISNMVEYKELQDLHIVLLGHIITEKIMQLSNRLQAVADLVTPGNRVADIGCDHAYTSIYLVEVGKSPYVISMDVNQGPLERAKENIKRYGYRNRIDIRRSNGLEKLDAGEVDTLLIAGMGGGLTLQILSENRDIVASVSEMVLQPQSEINLVRKALSTYGFLITNESMLKEDGKYYVCMKAEADSKIIDTQPYELTKLEHYCFGRLLLEGKNPVLREYLEKEKQQYENIYETLIAFPTKQSLLRQQELYQEIRLINQGLSYYIE